MARAGGGRRLSEVLQEQQELFLLYGATEAAPCCSSVNDKGAGASWGRAVRRALPGWGWDGLAAGCFPCANRKRESFRRLPRAGHAHCHDDDAIATESDGDGGDARRLSPVSVLDLLRCSDEEESSSPSSSSPPPTLRDWEEEDDEKPSPTSTPGSSPAPDPLTGEKKSEEEEWRKVVSSWERIAGDIARVPAMVGLDLLSASSASAAREWHGELAVSAEAELVGASVEAMIFEEMSAEAVRDMVQL